VKEIFLKPLVIYTIKPQKNTASGKAPKFFEDLFTEYSPKKENLRSPHRRFLHLKKINVLFSSATEGLL